MLLGVRRVSISAAAKPLQAAGIIEYSRGYLSVISRQELDERACSCGALVEPRPVRLVLKSGLSMRPERGIGGEGVNMRASFLMGRGGDATAAPLSLVCEPWERGKWTRGDIQDGNSSGGTFDTRDGVRRALTSVQWLVAVHGATDKSEARADVPTVWAGFRPPAMTLRAELRR